ncbi:DUF4166 domain-containing protein [Yoonia vestfoldensis]|uniref:DUF4166 domain-containing protein n=1 Tax=Yoonia vestfoldensis TaxID=245188 RepID=UPI000382520E|nr:DUF4166 domain-containing protein [Yoonia vestfoldensis]
MTDALFPRYLGADFAALPGEVQALHRIDGTVTWRGTASVTRGTSPWARLIAALFRFPKAVAETPVTVTMTPQPDGEVWVRQFGTSRFRSHLRLNGDRITERFGPFTFDLNLHVAADALHFPVTAGRIGPIPLPRRALPISIAREYAADGRFRFDVAIHAPLTGAPIVHYKGWLA